MTNMQGLGIVVPRRALISVSDKTGVVEFAQALAIRGVEILSTGGTAKTLRDAGVAVRDVSEYTGFPEMMEGRLKTLHPRVHGGLLGRKGTDDETMSQHGIEFIDIVAVNLYPFEKTIEKDGVTLEGANEQIDIGGPAMLRAAAKNHDRVAVLSEPKHYNWVLSQLDKHGGTTLAMRLVLKAEVFFTTSDYDDAIANYLAPFTEDVESII